MSSASNPYFNNFENTPEQNLVESLIIESISIYGHKVYFCPRTLSAKDEVYGEDDLSTYNSHHPIDIYIKNYDSYEGDGTFLSKFNLEIRDQVTFAMARKTFANQIGTELELERPREGDLIYSKMMNRLFIIKYVNYQPIFYQMGSLQTWDLVCEMFEYSNEKLNTGMPEIDSIEDKYSFANVTDSEEYEKALQDVYATNDEFQNLANNIVDWTEVDPFSEGNF